MEILHRTARYLPAVPKRRLTETVCGTEFWKELNETSREVRLVRHISSRGFFAQTIVSAALDIHISFSFAFAPFTPGDDYSARLYTADRSVGRHREGKLDFTAFLRFPLTERRDLILPSAHQGWRQYTIAQPGIFTSLLLKVGRLVAMDYVKFLQDTLLSHLAGIYLWSCVTANQNLAQLEVYCQV